MVVGLLLVTAALIYHDVVPQCDRDRSGFPGPLAARYKLDPCAFEAHLDAIAFAGMKVGLADHDSQVALTFDDGGRSALHIADALERRGWRGHFFITTGRLGTTGFLDAEDVRALRSRGHDIGSHSHSHPTYMGALTRTEIAREWVQSREALGDVVGTAPQTAAVPGGFTTPVVLEEAARAGYKLLMTSDPTRKRAQQDGMLVHGRYTIWATTSPRRAAGYARGDLVARATMRLAWHAKGLPKRLSPSAYEAIRRGWSAIR